jgi:hypothetical protein
MKGTLRNHPKMKLGGGGAWPPGFGGSHTTGMPYHTGEQGTLKGVKFVPADRSGPDRLQIAIEWGGNSLSGILQVNDESVLPQLDAFLRSHIGKELSVIGGLEVDL